MKYLAASNSRSTPSRRLRPAGLFLALLLLAACAPVGPNYHPPAPQAPDQWHSQLPPGVSGATPAPVALDRWWSQFNDPVLTELIKQAVAGNQNLKQAYGRLREARARLGVSRAAKFPTLDATGSATRSHSQDQTHSLYAAGFDAGWELDIFGGVRRSLEAATDELAASGEDLRDVMVSLLGEVATNYIGVRTYQARLAAATDNIKSQEDTYQLTEWQYQAGMSDDLAVEQARYNLASTRAQLPTLRVGLEASLNRLAILTGKPPGALQDMLAAPAPIPAPPATIAVGVPAEALRQRPDDRRAERH